MPEIACMSYFVRKMGVANAGRLGWLGRWGRIGIENLENNVIRQRSQRAGVLAFDVGHSESIYRAAETNDARETVLEAVQTCGVLVL